MAHFGGGGGETWSGYGGQGGHDGPPWGSGAPPWLRSDWQTGTLVETIKQTVVQTQTVTQGEVTTKATTFKTDNASTPSSPAPTPTPTPIPSLTPTNRLATPTSPSSVVPTAAASGTQGNHITNGLVQSLPSHSHSFAPSSSAITSSISSGNGTTLNSTSSFSSPSSHAGLIGGIVGGIALFLLLCGLTIFGFRRRARQHIAEASDVESFREKLPAVVIDQAGRSDSLEALPTLSSSPNPSTAANTRGGPARRGFSAFFMPVNRSIGTIAPLPAPDRGATGSHPVTAAVRRRQTKLEKERGYLNVSTTAGTIPSSVDETSSAGHASPGGLGLDASESLQVDRELRMLREEIVMLRAMEAERAWERGSDGNIEALPAYEYGPQPSSPRPPPVV